MTEPPRRTRLLAWAAWFVLWVALALALLASVHGDPRFPAGQRVDGLAALAAGVFAGRDTLTHDYPAYWWGWRQVRATGLAPLWNPSWFGGMPFVSSQTFMPFYPPNWLAAVLPFPLAFNLQYPLHLLIAAAVMAWAGRRRGLCIAAAGFAGLAWGFSSHLATLVGPGHIQKLQTLAWLPMVAVGARLVLSERRREGVIPLGVGLALQVLAGHLQIVYLTLLLCLAEFLAHFAWTAWRRRVSPCWFDGAVRHYALAGLLAVGLSAVFWLPTVEFARISNRQGALGFEDATRGSLPPEELFEFAMPRLRGDSMPFGRGYETAGAGNARPDPTPLYLGRYGESSTSAPERVVSDHVTVAVLLLPLFGLCFGRKQSRRILFHLLMAMLALLLSVGRYLDFSPLLASPYALFMRVVPLLSHFRSPSTMMALFSYSLALAAASGLHAMLASPRVPQHGFRVRLGIGLLLAAGLCCAWSWSLDPAATSESSAAVFALALRDILLGATLAAGVLGLLLLAADRRYVMAVVALLALGTAALHHRNIHPFWNATNLAPYKGFLERHWAVPQWEGVDQPVRFLEPGNELSNRALTLNDYTRLREVSSVHGYHPVAHGRYYRILDRLGYLDPNFLRMFAVNFLLWPNDVEREAPDGFDALPARGPKPLLYSSDHPFAWPVQHFKSVADFDTVLARLAGPGHNLFETTTILGEEMAGSPDVIDRPMDETSLEWRWFPLGPGRFRVATNALRGGWMVLSVLNYPGWRVRIDGRLRPDEPFTADGLLALVRVPAGKHELEMRYDPASQRLGLYLSLLAIAALSFAIGRRFHPRAIIPMKNDSHE